MIPNILKPAVKELLDQFSQALGNNGCNDFPLTTEQQAEVIKFLKLDPNNEDHMCGLETDYRILEVIQKELGL